MMKPSFMGSFFIVCGLVFLALATSLAFPAGANSSQPAFASGVPNISIPTVESRVVEIRTFQYVDRPATIIQQVKQIETTPVELRDYESIEELKQWLAKYENSASYYFQQTDGQVDCDDFALALQKQAMAEGYRVSFQIMQGSYYNQFFPNLQIPPDILHAIDLAIIGNSAYYIEPQTGEVALAAKLD